MPIDIILGLPHLRRGPILERAGFLQQPALISANALSIWRRTQGWPEWLGWRLGQLANAAGLASLDLDSAGFVAMARYRGFPWTIEAYFELASAFPFRRIASLDYCTEPEIAADRAQVLERVSRTIRANRDCRARAIGLGLVDRFMPVLQGRTPSDYERCAEALWPSMMPGAVIGVGSMCRRPIAGAEGLLAVVTHLHDFLPAGVGLHLFGVKGAALPYLKSFAGRVVSIDSQAYGIAARHDARRHRVAKSDALVADHMECWLRAQFRRLCEEARPVPAVTTARHSPPTNSWDRHMDRARAEIRALIESGDLAHDEIVENWVEAWAADRHSSGWREEGGEQ